MFTTPKTQRLIALFSAVFLLTSCQRAPQTSDSEDRVAPNLYPQFYPTEMEEYLPAPSSPILPAVPTTPPQNSNEGVWDVANVDISRVSSTRKLIAFTFDDAPAKTLENILAVFVNFNETNPDCPATATLFCNGRLISETSAHTLRVAYALGWELGNHTYAHPNLTTLSDEEFFNQINRTEKELSRIDKKSAHLFRAPYGKTDERIKSLSCPIINWSIDTLDWAGTSAQEISETVLSQKSDGAIVLMHDGYEQTVEALKILLPKLKEQNYQIVTVSQMAKAHRCVLRNGVTYVRARKKN